MISVLDHGFLLGDSVYEVLWWHRGAIIQEQEHMERLVESGRRLYMDLHATAEELGRRMRETVAAAEVSPDEDAYIRLMITRGAGPLGLDFRKIEKQSVVVIVAPANRPTPEAWERGLTFALVARQRNPQRALDPGAKTGNYLNNVLALHEAKLKGADDALMLNDRGEVTEATTANIYVVTRGGLVTPPLEAGILRGTTRTRILELCQVNGIPTREASLHVEDVRRAEEVFVSSSVRGILPVVSLDEGTVANGRPGPLTRRIRDLFEAAADEEARVTS